MRALPSNKWSYEGQYRNHWSLGGFISITAERNPSWGSAQIQIHFLPALLSAPRGFSSPPADAGAPGLGALPVHTQSLGSSPSPAFTVTSGNTKSPPPSQTLPKVDCARGCIPNRYNSTRPNPIPDLPSQPHPTHSTMQVLRQKSWQS